MKFQVKSFASLLVALVVAVAFVPSVEAAAIDVNTSKQDLKLPIACSRGSRCPPEYICVCHDGGYCSFLHTNTPNSVSCLTNQDTTEVYKLILNRLKRAGGGLRKILVVDEDAAMDAACTKSKLEAHAERFTSIAEFTAILRNFTDPVGSNPVGSNPVGSNDHNEDTDDQSAGSKRKKNGSCSKNSKKAKVDRDDKASSKVTHDSASRRPATTSKVNF
ncbi:hypothetical protein BGX26_000433 [Mortierella sp. AD094]|nr:hypothetical protein BGX26_000433 [Mortierella sp. AD094]